MFGKRKRNLFKLNLRDKFSPIKYDKIKFHEVSVCFVRKQNRDERKISPRNFTFIRVVLEIILFTSSRNFHFSSWHSLESSVAIFPSTIGIFSEDRKWIDFYSSSRWDPTGMERYDRERLRVLIEFPTLPDSNSTFISRFARESDPAEVRVSLISRLPPAEQQSISYRDRIIEKREDSCCHSPVPKLNSRSRRFISSRAPACRQLQLPNFIFHVFGHWETRVVKSTLVKLDWRTELTIGCTRFNLVHPLAFFSQSMPSLSRDKNQRVGRIQPEFLAKQESRVLFALEKVFTLGDEKKREKSLAFLRIDEKYPRK